MMLPYIIARREPAVCPLLVFSFMRIPTFTVVKSSLSGLVTVTDLLNLTACWFSTGPMLSKSSIIVGLLNHWTLVWRLLSAFLASSQLVALDLIALIHIFLFPVMKVIEARVQHPLYLSALSPQTTTYGKPTSVKVEATVVMKVMMGIVGVA